MVQVITQEFVNDDGSPDDSDAEISEGMTKYTAEFDARVALYYRALVRAGVPDVDDFFRDIPFYADAGLDGAVFVREYEDGCRLEAWVFGEADYSGKRWTLLQRAYGAVLTLVARDREVMDTLTIVVEDGIELTDDLIEEVMTAPEDAEIPAWLKQWMMLRLGS